MELLSKIQLSTLKLLRWLLNKCWHIFMETYKPDSYFYEEVNYSLRRAVSPTLYVLSCLIAPPAKFFINFTKKSAPQAKFLCLGGSFHPSVKENFHQNQFQPWKLLSKLLNFLPTINPEPNSVAYKKRVRD